MLTIAAPSTPEPVRFDTAPPAYKHWKLAVDGRVATLTLDVDEDAGLRPGYKLKLNSYDLGVDIEFRDALDRNSVRTSVGRVRRPSPARRTACSAPAPTSICSGHRRTRGK